MLPRCCGRKWSCQVQQVQQVHVFGCFWDFLKHQTDRFFGWIYSFCDLSSKPGNHGILGELCEFVCVLPLLRDDSESDIRSLTSIKNEGFPPPRWIAGGIRNQQSSGDDSRWAITTNQSLCFRWKGNVLCVNTWKNHLPSKMSHFMSHWMVKHPNIRKNIFNHCRELAGFFKPFIGTWPSGIIDSLTWCLGQHRFATNVPTTSLERECRLHSHVPFFTFYIVSVSFYLLCLYSIYFPWLC